MEQPWYQNFVQQFYHATLCISYKLLCLNEHLKNIKFLMELESLFVRMSNICVIQKLSLAIVPHLCQCKISKRKLTMLIIQDPYIFCLFLLALSPKLSLIINVIISRVSKWKWRMMKVWSMTHRLRDKDINRRVYLKRVFVVLYQLLNLTKFFVNHQHSRVPSGIRAG